MNKTWDDRMYIYSPPNNCNTVDDAHVPESYFNASKECVLPEKDIIMERERNLRKK